MHYSTEMYFYGYFQTDMFINFFILLWRIGDITWQEFVLIKWDYSSTKERSRLARMKHFACNCRI